ncbi:UNVERIFIED_CONTAM: hypothetical protein Sradi_3804700, partial [Sesamum radiatum]
MFDDVWLIMFRMKDPYVVPDQYIRYASTKAFFDARMIEQSSVREHGVMMISLVEKFKDLHIDLERKDTYIDVILQFLPPSFDQFIVNYNMNGLDKSFHEFINMLVQYGATIENFVLLVLVGEARMADVGRRRRMRHHQLLLALQVLLLHHRTRLKGKRKQVSSQRFQMMFTFTVRKRAIGRGIVLNSFVVK